MSTTHMIRDETVYSEDTLYKVYAALIESGLNADEGHRAISAMLNAGILFREREVTE